MLVIPAINCLDWSCVQKRLRVVQELGSKWVHIDISDGKFTPVVTWNKPQELKKLEIGNWKLEINLEVHLMVENPESYIREWVAVGGRRMIVHVEAFNGGRSDFPVEVRPPNIEMGLALKPDTPIDKIKPYLDKVNFVQFLAVSPGFSGQKLQSKVLGKIKALRAAKPDVIIEVDGGINLETARRIKEAGADIAVSASYLFSSPKPKEAYQALSNIASK